MAGHPLHEPHPPKSTATHAILPARAQTHPRIGKQSSIWGRGPAKTPCRSIRPRWRPSLFQRICVSRRATVTVAILCESACLLTTGHDALLGGATRGGLLTPAIALGLPVVERHARGFKVDVVVATPTVAPPSRSRGTPAAGPATSWPPLGGSRSAAPGLPIANVTPMKWFLRYQWSLVSEPESRLRRRVHLAAAGPGDERFAHHLVAHPRRSSTVKRTPPSGAQSLTPRSMSPTRIVRST